MVIIGHRSSKSTFGANKLMFHMYTWEGWQSFFFCFTGTHWRGALAERFPTTWWLLAWTRRSLGVFFSNPSLYLVFVAKF